MSFWKILKRPIQISVTYILFSVLALTVVEPQGFSATGSWDWKTAPSTENWKTFHKYSEAEKAKLWADLQKKNVPFEDLSWEWKLAWVRGCTFASTQDCSNIMQNGLFDKALVVRAEAANRLGQRFADTGHPPAIRLLKTAYAVQQNSRAKEPLFVQYRILQALNAIGGAGRSVGKQLALNSESMQKYWTRIATAR